MTIKNLLIDLDGTLTDPKVGIHTCIRYAMEKLGYPLKPDLDIDWTIGPPLKASFVKLLDNGDEQLAEQALLGYRERFSVVGLLKIKFIRLCQKLSDISKGRGINYFLPQQNLLSMPDKFWNIFSSQIILLKFMEAS